MASEVKVVIGANFGDECKGLVSGCLARDAWEDNKKVLTIFYNGTAQRGHTWNDQVLHNIGPGNLFGGDTYYMSTFVVDPIALWLTGETPIINPYCRVILPGDVVRNQQKELARDLTYDGRHGSCGMGLFECVKRHKEKPFYVADILSCKSIWNAIRKIDPLNNDSTHIVYNARNFLIACDWLKKHCKIAYLEDIIHEYDTVIFEGGQGLLLDQSNLDMFPHLTPSSVGADNIASALKEIGLPAEIYYVSRSYITRHGAGPILRECKREDINPDIVDKTNAPNPWQGNLRFGYLDTEKQFERIKKDFAKYVSPVSPRLVYTHMNYTDGKLATAPNKLTALEKPDFIDEIYGSWSKESFEKL